MPKQFGLTEARAIVAYLERVEIHYSLQGDASTQSQERIERLKRELGIR